MRSFHFVLSLVMTGCCFAGPSPLPFPPTVPPSVPVPPVPPPVVVPPMPVTVPPIPIPPPIGATPTATGAPDGWPEGFPVVAGGTPMVVPPAGPVRVAVLAYTGMTPDVLDATYHAELATAGWTATASETGPEAHRFTATRGATSVWVSIYGEGAQTMIQTMQMLF